MRDWIIGRAPDGTPLRMRWCPGLHEAMEPYRQEKERNRTLRYVEPNPYDTPSTEEEEK